MSNNVFREIERLHSEWEKMGKSAKLVWLSGEKMRLNRLVDQFAQYISVRGGFSNEEEKAYARRLLEMINMVDAEGSKVINDLASKVFKDIMKGFMR
ncbi:MAG: hypothetical protein IJ190_06100 [Prevotella sp.]|nr:hypothetical protein [Prevotella sp.]